MGRALRWEDRNTGNRDDMARFIDKFSLFCMGSELDNIYVPLLTFFFCFHFFLLSDAKLLRSVMTVLSERFEIS